MEALMDMARALILTHKRMATMDNLTRAAISSSRLRKSRMLTCGDSGYLLRPTLRISKLTEKAKTRMAKMAREMSNG